MADTSTTPAERVRIFDPDGLPLAEFRARVQRSWVIGDTGRATFSYASRKTNVVNEKALQFGNWLLVESDTLPAWVGVIDTPRYWSARSVDVFAYTPEHVFGWRRGPLEDVLTGSAGTIFEGILNRVNYWEPTIIQAGDIWRGGVQRQETINPTLLNKDLKRITERSQEEYQWRPSTGTNGRLVVYADWLEQLGEDTSVMLHEGAGGGNIEAVGNIMVEDGPIVNEVLTYGDGETWRSKPRAVVRDQDSIGRYVLRQDAKGYSGVTNVQTLTDNGANHIAQFKSPARTFRLNALNVGDTFKYIRLGNRLPLQFQNIGFYTGEQGLKTRVRIVGMAYDSSEKNKINLAVEEKA